MTSIRQILLIAALAVFLAGPVMAAESGSQRYIVILKSRSGPAPDLAHLGGTVTFRQDDEVIVTLPPSALPSLKADPLVRYIQSLAGTDQGAAPLAGEPDEPAAGAPRRLVPHATAGNLSWSRQYAYDDSGNIINIGSQQFVYDALGRLKEMATDGSSTESYEYDRYGNQTKRTTSAGTQLMDTEPTTNRLSSGYGYDRAGNVTSGDSYVLAYDPLGQTATKTYTGTTTFNETYIYTANDERIGVQTSNSSETSSWWYWSVRDEGGKVLRQYRSSANDPTQAALWIEDYVYRDGQLVGAERPPTLGGRRHFHLDHLGSPHLITSDTGLIVSTHDYLPFGGESSSPFQETGAGFDREDPMKFTGHERDYAGSFGREDGHAIDYMHARYYSPTAGRFLSPDPLGGHMEDPQTFNRYAYAGNNPITLTDPTGLDFYLQCTGNSDTCQGGHAGTSATDANGKTTFTVTVVTSASLQDSKSGNSGTVNENGLQITTSGHTYQGIFKNNTPSADLNGSGRLQGFSFHIGSSDEKHGVLSAGEFTFHGNRDQTRSTLDQRGAYRSIMDSRFPFGRSPDELAFHSGSTQHRFGTGPAPHFLVRDNPMNTVPTLGGFHVDGDRIGLKHFSCAWLGVACN